MDNRIDLQGVHADRIMAVTLGLLLVVVMAVAAFTGTWFAALAVGIPAFAVPLALIYMAPGKLAARIGVAVAFMVYAALLIQQSHGMIEAHFSIFVLLAFLLFYRDWKPILVAAVVIEVHHVAFYFLQVSDSGIYLLSQGAGFDLVVIHALFVVFESALLIYMAIKLRMEMRMLGGTPEEVVEIVRKVANGYLSTQIEIKADDTKSLMASMKVMLSSLNEADAAARETARVKATLDNAVINIMMADNDGIIRYMNKSTEQLLRRSEPNIRKVLPNFSADKVLNQNFDIFHRNPAHQRNLLAELKGTHIANIAMGDLFFRLTASPITNLQGERIGVVLEWFDRTADVTGERELSAVITAATNGDLAIRLNSADKEGFNKQLAEGMNQLLDTVSEPLTVISEYLNQIAKGVIPAQITTDYKGEYLVIRDNLNSLVNMMRELLSETDSLIMSAANGELDKRANAAQFQGGWNELVTGVNQIIDGIVLPVNEVAKVLAEMEKGDLTCSVNGDYKGQLNDFKNTVNNTIAKLSQVIGEVNSEAINIASASEEVSSTAQIMSQATNEQAASVEETSASIEQIGASINQNSENAKVTEGMAAQAAKQATAGGLAVK